MAASSDGFMIGSILKVKSGEVFTSVNDSCFGRVVFFAEKRIGNLYLSESK